MFPLKEDKFTPKVVAVLLFTWVHLQCVPRLVVVYICCLGISTDNLQPNK